MEIYSPEILASAAFVWVILHQVGYIPVGGKPLSTNLVWRKLLPLLPLVLGVGVAFIPGFLLDETNKVTTGLWVGLIAAHGRKLLKRSFFDSLSDLNKPKK